MLYCPTLGGIIFSRQAHRPVFFGFCSKVWRYLCRCGRLGVFFVAICLLPNFSAWAAPLSGGAWPTDWQPLDDDSKKLLVNWFTEVGQPRPNETFGDLIARAGRVQLGRPYLVTAETGGPEALQVLLTSLNCVSLVEATLALARCIWLKTPNENCFMQEMQLTRYRQGLINGYASRLHYFPDWLNDNGERGRLRQISADLGGTSSRYDFFYMTKNVRHFPAMTEKSVFNDIQAIEKSLSLKTYFVLGKDKVKPLLSQMQNGDLVAIASSKLPGNFISHVGLIDRSIKNIPRLLHASSHHKRVVLTVVDIAGYLNSRPERLGLMVSRFLPPNLPAGEISQ